MLTANMTVPIGNAMNRKSSSFGAPAQSRQYSAVCFAVGGVVVSVLMVDLHCQGFTPPSLRESRRGMVSASRSQWGYPPHDTN
jgi:hypothetical protein